MNSDFKELGGRDPHSLLGLQHGASEEEVVRAFRRNAARGGHPDIGGDERTFRHLTRARDVLLDSQRLAAYNATQQAVRVQSPPSSFSQGRAQSPGEPAGNDTGAAQTEPRRSPAPPASPEMNAFAAITVVLILLGPLAWPVAIVTGYFALRQMGRSSQRRGSPV